MEAVIEDWGRKNYPRLMENPKLIESLYRKKVLNQPTALPTMTYPLVKAMNLKPDTSVTMVVTKVDVSIKETDVCKQCGRKTCAETGHGTARVPFYIVGMMAGDDTGMATFKRIGTDHSYAELMEKNEEFIISGVMRAKERFGEEVEIKSIAPLSKAQLEAWDSLEEYNSIHGGESGISEEEFAKVTAGKEELLKPFMDRVFVSRHNGRVRW